MVKHSIEVTVVSKKKLKSKHTRCSTANAVNFVAHKKETSAAHDLPRLSLGSGLGQLVACNIPSPTL